MTGQSLKGDGQPGTGDVRGRARGEAERHLARHDMRQQIDGSGFSRLERLALAIGVTERPHRDCRGGIARWGAMFLGLGGPRRLADERLETLRRLASVLSHGRTDLLPKAEDEALRAGYSPGDIRAYIERRIPGSGSEFPRRPFKTTSSG